MVSLRNIDKCTHGKLIVLGDVIHIVVRSLEPVLAAVSPTDGVDAKQVNTTI